MFYKPTPLRVQQNSIRKSSEKFLGNLAGENYTPLPAPAMLGDVG